MQITKVHGIFLLLPTLDLWGLPSNLLSYLPSIASPSSPPPLSAEQPLLPGERWHQLEKWGTGPGLEQCRCWEVACIDWRWCWGAPPTPACPLICRGSFWKPSLGRPLNKREQKDGKSKPPFLIQKIHQFIFAALFEFLRFTKIFADIVEKQFCILYA